MMILNSYIAFIFPLPETLLGIKSTHYVYVNPESFKRKKKHWPVMINSYRNEKHVDI